MKKYYIHQLWWPFTEKASLTPPSKYDPNIQTWKEKNPNAYHKIWNKDECKQLLSEYYPWFLDIWTNFELEIQRSDSIRPFLLHHYGGIYADMDTACYQDFEEFMKQAPIIIGNEYGNPWIRLVTNKKLLENAIMVCRAPGHPFWLHYVKSMNSKKDVLKSTGPWILTEAYESFDDKSDILLLDRKVFYPIPFAVTFVPLVSKLYSKEDMQNPNFGQKFNAKAFASHQYDGTWKEENDHWLTKKVGVIALVLLSTILALNYMKKNKNKMYQ